MLSERFRSGSACPTYRSATPPAPLVRSTISLLTGEDHAQVAEHAVGYVVIELCTATSWPRFQDVVHHRLGLAAMLDCWLQPHVQLAQPFMPLEVAWPRAGRGACRRRPAQRPQPVVDQAELVVAHGPE